MQLMRLLLLLSSALSHYKSLARSATTTAAIAPRGRFHIKLAPAAPQYMTGEVPGNGEPYQIVRIIEYIVPHPYKRKEPKPKPAPDLRAPPLSQGASKTAPLSTNAEDSLEIIPANVESLFTLEPAAVATTTRKPLTPSQYLLRVRLRNTTICAGALISARLVLTSSHCFSGKPQKPAALYKAVASKERVFEVDKLLLDSAETHMAKELALLVLKASIPLESAAMQPLALCSRALKKADNVTMYMSQTQLHFLRTTVIANGACKRSYAQDDAAYITEGMLCAHNTNKLKDCHTQIGDPLLHPNEQLCGINIYGPRCEEHAVNGDLYANIFKARDSLERFIRRYP